MALGEGRWVRFNSATGEFTSSCCIEDMNRRTCMDTTSYRCTVCGYVYDPTKGDDVSGIAPGTTFEDLPADWTCPVCGAPKDMFEKVE